MDQNSGTSFLHCASDPVPISFEEFLLVLLLLNEMICYSVISRSVTSRRGTARRHAACDHVVQNKFIPWHVKTCHCPDTWLQSFIPDAVPYPAWYPDLPDSSFVRFLGVSGLEHGKQSWGVVRKSTVGANWHYYVINFELMLNFKNGLYDLVL